MRNLGRGRFVERSGWLAARARFVGRWENIRYYRGLRVHRRCFRVCLLIVRHAFLHSRIATVVSGPANMCKWKEWVDILSYSFFLYWML